MRRENIPPFIFVGKSLDVEVARVSEFFFAFLELDGK
jgi:hypothetical protein